MKDYSESNRVWELLKASIERFLEQRTETILSHYSIDMTAEEYRRLAKEEKFVEVFAGLSNECESYVNIHRNKINEQAAELEEAQRYIGAIAEALTEQIDENIKLTKLLLEYTRNPEFKNKHELLEEVKKSTNERFKKETTVI